uniref:3'-5' exonuclease n=1 Tax=Coccolithus braarudii TaxID=221442 RepID=A0A7S0LL15_9EUKA
MASFDADCCDDMALATLDLDELIGSTLAPDVAIQSPQPLIPPQHQLLDSQSTVHLYPPPQAPSHSTPHNLQEQPQPQPQPHTFEKKRCIPVRGTMPSSSLPASPLARQEPNQPSAGAPCKRRLPASFTRPQQMPVLAPPRMVTLSRSAAEAEELLQQWLHLHGTSSRPVGFDIEWKVTFVAGETPRKVATLQLAHESSCLVLQLSAMPHFPANLAVIMGDSRIIKTGVGIRNDALKLARDYGVRCAGILDLGRVAQVVLPDGAAPWSLADLSERVLGRRLPKAPQLRLSNWEARLSPEQVAYAALDAHAAVHIFRGLIATYDQAHPQGPTLAEVSASLLDYQVPYGCARVERS